MNAVDAAAASRARRSPVAWLVAVLVIGVSWLLVVARSVPGRNGDRGVFASMAERLAAGDVLYVDSWDNKEPLFYLTLALGRLVAPQMDVVIEALWLVLAALAAWAILRANAVRGPMAALVGLGLTPLIITGSIYLAGFSHLPGIVLVLAGYALLANGRPLLAGILLPVLVAFKVVMVPLALAALLVWLIQHRRWLALRAYVIGVAISSVVLVLLLALRGEFTGFIELLISNVGYSQSPISDAYQIPLWVHIEPVMQGPAVAVFAATVLVLTVTRMVGLRNASELWWATVATLIASFLVIAVSGLWPHHGQALYVPAVLAFLLLVVVIPRGTDFTLVSIVLAISATVVLSGAPSLRSTIDSVLSARGLWQDLSRTADSTAALLSAAPSGGSYARLGKNTDDSHAQGLREFTHPCRQWVQYTYDIPSTLEGIPDCLPTVDYVIVDKGLVPEPDQPLWNTFVTRSEAVLATDFTCTPFDWGRLCVNNRISQADVAE